MADEFKLRIRLGNAAMMNGADVADALRRVADVVQDSGDDSAGIRDLNGNTVGSWDLSLPDDE